MSDAAVFSEPGFADFGAYSAVMEGRKNNYSKTRDSKLALLKLIALLMTVLVLVAVVVNLVVLPTLVPVKINISGLNTITVEQVQEKVDEMQASTWIKFDAARAVGVISSISCVERVSVDKRFPDKVYIRVKEREPVAKAIVPVNGRLETIQIDQNGVLFNSSASGIAKDSSVPLISGLPLQEVQDGMRLPVKYRSLMEQIARIRSLPQKYFAAISEIQVVSTEYGNYELVLYPIHTHVKVLTDRSLSEDSLKYMMVVLDVVNSIDPNVGVIDLRYGAVSYRRR